MVGSRSWNSPSYLPAWQTTAVLYACYLANIFLEAGRRALDILIQEPVTSTAASSRGYQSQFGAGVCLGSLNQTVLESLKF